MSTYGGGESSPVGVKEELCNVSAPLSPSYPCRSNGVIEWCRAMTYLCSTPVGFGQGLQLLVQVVEQRNQEIEHHHDHQQCKKGCECIPGPWIHLTGNLVPAVQGIREHRPNIEVAT